MVQKNLIPKDVTDVKITYYAETSKGHPIGYIFFKNEFDTIINSERVELSASYSTLYFKTDHGNKGLKLNNHKIQLWSLAHIAKDWEGQYPLKYDLDRNCYCIYKADRQEDPRSSYQGDEWVHYVPKEDTDKVKENADKTNEVVEVEPETEVKNACEDVSIGDISMQYLEKRVVDFVIQNRLEEARLLGQAVDVLRKDFENTKSKA